MLPRKKLEYYAARCGIEYDADSRMSSDEQAKICAAVGAARIYSPNDADGGKIGKFIDLISDDPGFRSAHSPDCVGKDFLECRFPDYAAEAVMRELARIRSRSRV